MHMTGSLAGALLHANISTLYMHMATSQLHFVSFLMLNSHVNSELTDALAMHGGRP